MSGGGKAFAFVKGKTIKSSHELMNWADLLPSFGFKVTASSTGDQLLMSVFALLAGPGANDMNVRCSSFQAVHCNAFI